MVSNFTQEGGHGNLMIFGVWHSISCRYDKVAGFCFEVYC